MEIKNSIALVTGANRGLGRHFAQQLLERGAAKVYATARRPELVDLPGADVLRLDVTDPASVAAAAAAAPDLTLLINNAGSTAGGNLLTGDKTNIVADLNAFFWGPLELVRAFAPILRANRGGGILNVNSAMSWTAFDGANAYHVAKAAEWALTNALQVELAEQRTHVAGLYFGMTDTGHQEFWDGPLNDPADIVRIALDAFEAGEQEIVADELGAAARARLVAGPGKL